MSKSIEIFALTCKPTTHCIIIPAEANEDHDQAAELLIEHIKSISGNSGPEGLYCRAKIE